ncbi:MAG: response regulator transcription factor [Calditrichia bacterium]|nr:response regulator transcription factor [Calditrichota bacterium]MCB9068426.1 response regulator transcription factor [Calditrichia bacterium]
MKVLIVEDEKKVAQFIERGLSEENFEVAVVNDGDAGLAMAMSNSFDLVILDLMLPGKSGLDVCRELRQYDTKIPVLMLTARDTVEDKVRGLECGADDYLTKPFSFDELIARLRALARRVERKDAPMLVIDDLTVDVLTRKAFRSGEEIYLSAKEFDLLVYFLKNRNKVISRQMLAENVWDIHFDTGTNYIDVYVNYLRNKLKAGSGRQLIFTIRGSGYIMKDVHA